MSLELPETFCYEKRGHIALMTINCLCVMNVFIGEMFVVMDVCFVDFQ